MEDAECERGAIYDEDDDAAGGIELLSDDGDDSQDEWNYDSDSEHDHDLYDTKLDQVDDVLFVKEQLDALRQSNPAHW